MNGNRGNPMEGGKDDCFVHLNPKVESRLILLNRSKWFGKPFDRLTVLCKVEGLTVLSKVEGLTTLSRVEGQIRILNDQISKTNP